MCPDDDHCLCKSLVILSYCPLKIYHMATDLWTLEPCIFIWLCELRSIRLHMGRCDDHWLCRSHCMIAFWAFVVYHVLTDIWSLGRGFLVWFSSFAKLCYAHVSARRTLMMYVSFHYYVLYFWNLSYADWYFKSRVGLLCLLFWIELRFCPPLSVQL